jgi:hypothetical protein
MKKIDPSFYIDEEDIKEKLKKSNLLRENVRSVIRSKMDKWLGLRKLKKISSQNHFDFLIRILNNSEINGNDDLKHFYLKDLL